MRTLVSSCLLLSQAVAQDPEGGRVAGTVFDALLQVVPSTGTYPLRLSLSHVRGRPREEIALPAASAAVVVEGRADQVFELSIDADALAAAIVEFDRTGR